MFHQHTCWQLVCNHFQWSACWRVNNTAVWQSINFGFRILYKHVNGNLSKNGFWLLCWFIPFQTRVFRKVARTATPKRFATTSSQSSANPDSSAYSTQRRQQAGIGVAIMIPSMVLDRLLEWFFVGVSNRACIAKFSRVFWPHGQIIEPGISEFGREVTW